MRIADSGASGQWRPCGGDADTPDALLDAVAAGATGRVCGDCHMGTECLEYALIHDNRFGIEGAGRQVGRRVG